MFMSGHITPSCDQKLLVQRANIHMKRQQPLSCMHHA